MPNQPASDTIRELKLRLRKQCRLKRQSLNKFEFEQASKQLNEQFSNHFSEQKFHKIALYLHQDNELGTADLMSSLLSGGHQLYLPKINPSQNNDMSFVQYDESCKLAKNRFGIDEPEGTTTIAIEDLDLILLPLTAFDLQGNRLGMGGGFYDRALANLPSKSAILIGLAYDFQQVQSCPVESFDKPLDHVLTPTRMLDFN